MLQSATKSSGAGWPLPGALHLVLGPRGEVDPTLIGGGDLPAMSLSSHLWCHDDASHDDAMQQPGYAAALWCPLLSASGWKSCQQHVTDVWIKDGATIR